jgi:hypothetical protein
MIITINTEYDIEIKTEKQAKSLDEYTRMITALQLASDMIKQDMLKNTSQKVTKDSDNLMQEHQQYGENEHTMQVVLFNRKYRNN